MKRMLKVLGLALLAVFATNAVFVSAASANFTTATHGATLTLSGGLQVFTTQSGSKVECTSVSGHISGVETVQSALTVVPVYSGCTLTEGGITRNAQVVPTGCDYLFTTTGQVHIECEPGSVITVKAFIAGAFQQCFDIHAQTPTVPNVHFTNQLDSATGKWDFTIVSTVTGITYERTGACKKLPPEVNETNNAHYVGSVTVKCDFAGENAAVDCTKTAF
jgi:hypothetical protein